jgi:hypothetical protein
MVFGYQVRSPLSLVLNGGDINCFSDTVFGVLVRYVKSSISTSEVALVTEIVGES